MAYKGDTHLEQLLKAAGEQRSMQEIKDVLKGILAAPEDIAAPTLWLRLFKVESSPEAAEQLAALKEQIAAS